MACGRRRAGGGSEALSPIVKLLRSPSSLQSSGALGLEAGAAAAVGIACAECSKTVAAAGAFKADRFGGEGRVRKVTTVGVASAGPPEGHAALVCIQRALRVVEPCCCRDAAALVIAAVSFRPAAAHAVHGTEGHIGSCEGVVAARVVAIVGYDASAKASGRGAPGQRSEGRWRASVPPREQHSGLGEPWRVLHGR